MNAGTKNSQNAACFVLPGTNSMPEIFDSVKGAQPSSTSLEAEIGSHSPIRGRQVTLSGPQEGWLRGLCLS